MHRTKRLLGLAVLAASMVATLFVGVGHAAFADSPPITSQDWYVASDTDPWGTAFDSSGHVWVAVPGCDPQPTCPTGTPPGKIEEFDPTTSSWIATIQLPKKFSQALFLAFDAKGRLWFAMPDNNSIGMYNPATKKIHQWAVPTAGAGPWDVVVDHKGMIWFTEHFTNKIGELNVSQAQPGTTSGVTEYAYPANCTTCGTHTSGISVDSTGLVWFDDSLQSIFGSFPDTGTGSFTEYATPTANAHPHDGLKVDSQNRIWFDEEFQNKLAEAG